MSYRYKTIEGTPEISGKRVVMLADFSVPIENGEITDDYRLMMTLPTIKLLREKGAILTVISKIGDDGSQSLRPVVGYLEKELAQKIAFTTSIEETVSAVKHGRQGSVIIIENIRRFKGEKENDPGLAKEFASFGEYFVNEGFSVSHRPYASVVGVAKLLPSYAGLLFDREVKNLSRAFTPEHPFVLILGGKKAETKIPLTERFIDSADVVIMGGALANDFLKAKGLPVGRSVVSGKELIKKEWFSNPKFLIPDNLIVQNGSGSREISPNEVGPDDMIVDVGPEFLTKAARVLKEAKFVVWNGSFGICEKGFETGTRGIAEEVVSSGAFSIVGGGDTTAAIDAFKMTNKFSFVSTGGGAMLDFLANGTLPGLEALEK
ncbi:MAG: phosphoglycerate kinase [Candidatus Taylorbacteria bacterium]|nr:phosphoglycerate kinase [Candidatus Taylorbacteria bacterium]